MCKDDNLFVFSSLFRPGAKPTDMEGDEDRPVTKKKGAKKILKKTISSKPFIENLSDDEDDDGDGETYLKKFDKEINDRHVFKVADVGNAYFGQSAHSIDFRRSARSWQR